MNIIYKTFILFLTLSHIFNFIGSVSDFKRPQGDTLRPKAAALSLSLPFQTGEQNPKPQRFAVEVAKTEVRLAGKKVLTLGSQDGGDEIFFAGLGAEVTVIDMDRAHLQHLEGRDKISPMWGDMRKVLPSMTREGRKFDIVYARLSLHWMGRQGMGKVIEAVKELLVPGGRFYFVVKSDTDPHYTRSIQLEKRIPPHGF
jgi:SAM-dependent methyltransferase